MQSNIVRNWFIGSEIVCLFGKCVKARPNKLHLHRTFPHHSVYSAVEQIDKAALNDTTYAVGDFREVWRDEVPPRTILGRLAGGLAARQPPKKGDFGEAKPPQTPPPRNLCQ